MNAIVRIIDSRAMADSRDVAAHFEKRHDHVLRDVDRLIELAPDLAPNFGFKIYPVATGKGATRHARRADMDRTGFTLLVMGFTGAKALAAKLAWIKAFDRMEAALASAELPDPESAPLPIDFAEKLRFVREARVLGGREAGRRAWCLAELPDVFTHLPRLPDRTGGRRSGEPDERIAEWMAERIEPADGRVRSSLLYADYLAWCARSGLEPRTQTAFSLQLTGAGLHSRRSGVVWFVGVRLIEADS